MSKCTQVPGERPKAGSCSCAVSISKPVLDTFSLTAPSSVESGLRSAPKTGAEAAKKKLQKRAQSKYVTNLVAFPLAKLSSPLQKQYKRSTNCAGEITETPGKYTSLYCNCRWCLICSKIRTGRLIVGYLPAIQAMREKWFVTLSRPNVAGPALADEIQYYLRTATLIQRHLREKRKLEYSSLRKIECTYNELVNTYHPHFHFIFDSWEAANAFLQEWLARNSVEKVGKAHAALLDKGNQIKKADDKSVVELFKYFTKVVSKSRSKGNDGKESSSYRIHLQALDTMFQAMQRVRTFQPCGVIKAVSEDVEPEQSLESGQAQHNHYKWLGHDWVNVETQAALTGFQPSEHQRAIEQHLVYPAGVPTVAPAPATPYFVDKETGEVVPNELIDLRIMRNSMQYAKIYPVLGEDDVQARRKPCNIPATPWERIEQHSREEEPVQLVPVAPTEPALLPLFAQPDAAPGGAGQGGTLGAQRGAPVGDLPTPGKSLLPVRKTAERKTRPRTAQVPPSTLTSAPSLFSNVKTNF